MRWLGAYQLLSLRRLACICFFSAKAMGLLAFMALHVSCGEMGLDWSADNLACEDTTRRCLSGYSCLGNTCIADHTVALGERCLADAQCPQDGVCGTEVPRVCRKKCGTEPNNASFYGVDVCPATQWCKPLSGDGRAGGECSRGACLVGEPCRDDLDVCVQLSTTASACLPSCAVSFTGANYGDNCGSTEAAPKYCQPLGVAPGQQRLICLDAPTAYAQPLGAACRLGTTPCQAGSACVGSVCRAFCPLNGTSVCSEGTTCCQVELSTAGNLLGDASKYGVCVSAEQCNLLQVAP